MTRTTTRFRGAMAVVAVVALLAAAGCSDDDDDTTDAGGATTSTTAATVEATAPEGTDAGGDEGAEAGEVVVTDSTLGEVLVVDGLPLYAFDRDTPESSSCVDACAQAWPPVAADTPLGEGVEVTVGSIAREDGTEQLTINGAPVYTFATDEPLPADGTGEPLGQGASDVWWVLAADGNPIRDVASN